MKKFLVKKPVLWSCLAMVMYYAIMQVYYIYFISVEYHRYGFFLKMNINKYVEVNFYFFLALILAVLISKASEFIYCIFMFLMIFFFVPELIVYSLCDQPSGPLYATIGLVFGVGIISSFKFKMPPIHTPTLSYGLIVFLVIITLLPFVLNFGVYFNLGNIVLQDVYETRDYFSERSSMGIDYLYNWLVKALIPLCLVFFLINKRFTYALIALVILLYLYMISGNKIVYITLFVMLFFYYVGKEYPQKVNYFMLALVVGLLLMPLVDFYVLNSHSMKGIFVMRMLFLPSQLNYYYFDLFDGHPLYFAESNFFKLFFTYPFDQPVGFVIAKKYFDAPDMNANNGIIGDGFMNLGYSGVVLNILIVVTIFLFFNSADPDPHYLGIFFVIIFLFLSAPMLSMFITSGLWIVFLLSLTMMKRKQVLA